MKNEPSSFVIAFLRRRRTWAFHVLVLQRTTKKCTKTRKTQVHSFVLLSKPFVCWRSRCRGRSGLLRPRPHVSGYFFNPHHFLLRRRLASTRMRRIRQQIWTSLNPLSRMEKNKPSMNSMTCGRVNPDIFESDDVANSWPVFHRKINQYSFKAHSLITLYCRGVLGSWVNSDTIGYMWTGDLNTLRANGEIFESGKKSCGFKISGYVRTGP